MDLSKFQKKKERCFPSQKFGRQQRMETDTVVEPQGLIYTINFETRPQHFSCLCLNQHFCSYQHITANCQTNANFKKIRPYCLNWLGTISINQSCNGSTFGNMRNVYFFSTTSKYCVSSYL